MPLVVVPTPIGNLEDITLRGLRTLREADVIAAEDTRLTLKLLNYYGIRRPLISCHMHNERRRASELTARIAGGETVALVSDAGTPGLSDPGYAVIKEAIELGLPVDVLPGANALLPALLLSGIAPDPFFFAGFLRGGETERRTRLTELSGIRATLVFYVAPHDLKRDAALMASVLGGRAAALIREISKAHQEATRGTLEDIADAASEREMKGEMAIVVEGASETPEREEPDEWIGLAARMKAEGIFDREIVSVLSASYGIPRNRIKELLLKLKAETGGSE